MLRSAPAILGALALLVSTSTMAASPLDGSIRIINKRSQAISVSVDGRQSYQVAAKSKATLKQVPNGLRWVVIKGAGAPTETRELAVHPNQRSKMRVAPIMGRAQVINNASLSMQVFLNGRTVTLASGQSWTSPPLEIGRHLLRTQPTQAWARRGKGSERAFTVVANRTKSVTIGKWFGSLSVNNPFPVRTTLMVDGKAVKELRAGQSTLLTRQLPGKHQVSLRHGPRTLSAATLKLTRGQRRNWVPDTSRLGSLKLTNTTRRTLIIEVAGQRLGQLAPGATGVFAAVPAGTQTIIAFPRNRRGKRIKQTVRVARAGTTRAVLAPRRQTAAVWHRY